MASATYPDPEAKSADAEEAVCARRTVGLLRRRVVKETSVVHVRKEANKLEEVETGLEHDPEVIYTEYRDPKRDPWRSQAIVSQSGYRPEACPCWSSQSDGP